MVHSSDCTESLEDGSADKDDEFENNIEEDQEIRGFSVIIECITKNSVISLLCPPTSLELLYLCFVIDYGVADVILL